VGPLTTALRGALAGALSWAALSLVTGSSATAPSATASTTCLKMLSLGDWGTAAPVADGFGPRMAAAAAAGSLGCAWPAAAVMLQGDNFYSFGVADASDPQFATKYQALFSDPRFAATPMLVMQGNHDHYGNVTGQTDYTWRDPTRRWWAPAANYTTTVSQNGVTVFLVTLDTWDMIGGDTDDNKSPTYYLPVLPGFIAWVAQVLASPAAQSADWLVVRGHYPVYSGSLQEHGDTRGLVVTLDPLLQAYGVDMYLSGHEHVLEHIVRGSVAYFVSGAGGVTHAPVNATYPGMMGYLDGAFGYVSHVFTKDNCTTRFHSQGNGSAPAEVVTYTATTQSLAPQRRAALAAPTSPAPVPVAMPMSTPAPVPVQGVAPRTPAPSSAAPTAAPSSSSSSSSGWGVFFLVLLLLVGLPAAALWAWRRFGARLFSGGRVSSPFTDDYDEDAFSAHIDMRHVAPYRGVWSNAAVPAPDRSIQMV